MFLDEGLDGEPHVEENVEDNEAACIWRVVKPRVSSEIEGCGGMRKDHDQKEGAHHCRNQADVVAEGLGVELHCV